MSIKNNIKKSTVAISTHYLIYSASQALRDFLRSQGCSFLLYISHPLPIDDTLGDTSFCEVSHGDRIVHRFTADRRFTSLVISSLYETYLTVSWVLWTGRHFDLFVAVDNLNAFQAIILKWVGRVDTVIYYTIDMFPKRFENKFLNWLYIQLDRFCVRYADETWNVSGKMKDVRGDSGSGRQYTVPIGIWYDKAPRKPFSAIDKKKLIFVGHLVPHMGVDLIIRAMPEIIKKIPGVTLDIIGGGEELSRLQSLSRSLHVTDVIKFHGWVRSRKRLESLLACGAVGLATFNTDILDEKVRNADPGKIKDYMQAGMPVIATDALSSRDDITAAHAGIIIPYTEDALVDAVTALLTGKDMLQDFRRNALAYVQQFDYATLFAQHLRRHL